MFFYQTYYKKKLHLENLKSPLYFIVLLKPPLTNNSTMQSVIWQFNFSVYDRYALKKKSTL